jgi:hypothetical protein
VKIPGDATFSLTCAIEQCVRKAGADYPTDQRN